MGKSYYVMWSMLEITMYCINTKMIDGKKYYVTGSKVT